MNLLSSTLLYMFLAIILLFIADTVFNKTNFKNYATLLNTRDKICMYMVVVAFIYLIYVVAFMEFILPLYIIAILICSMWAYFLFFDIELKVMTITDRLIIVIITSIMVTLAFFGLEYILLLGIMNKYQINVKGSSQLFDHPKVDTVYVTTDKEECEIVSIMSMLITLYKTDIIHSKDELLKSISIMIEGEHVIYSPLEFNLNA